MVLKYELNRTGVDTKMSNNKHPKPNTQNNIKNFKMFYVTKCPKQQKAQNFIYYIYICIFLYKYAMHASYASVYKLVCIF